MTGARIDVRALAVAYPGTVEPVLSDLDLVIEPGEFLAILGPSGCGKSTLLNAIAGFVRPSAGAVYFNGTPVIGPGRERGVVFQRDILFPWASVEKNVGFALRAAHVPRAQRRACTVSLLEAVGLSAAVLRRLPHELSGGMRQRVGIARALANKPQVLLMDEPFGALDAQTRSQMQDLVSDLWERTDTTIAFVTHDVDEALRVASTVVVLGAHGAVVDRLDNPLPRPRPAGTIGEFADYPALRRRLHERLRPDPQPLIMNGDRR
ncbi:ABC transporter [Mycolicibacterium moriokaense]|uniref:ABC transporter ATP-binding protein n=1 Tax=Mycolicibacterium moriokaense TaxID=39691 RepID=A0AAD1HAH4_9MYCO|nr:ABC transporter ATP-binding protein [Mycolicibacterium moriokaense]MCV7042641.1 ABC transporter ATP-binding protein [Mycolicibacterium moriokaense]ORB23446.1 ABC transporter [Mycolicibacterium moriokaense]BBX01190.1 ABC transporter ATP-binding protein [Mycolicibacterium moriokaense]